MILWDIKTFYQLHVLYVVLRTDLQPLAKLFRAQVLKMHKEENLFDDRFVAMILKWP